MSFPNFNQFPQQNEQFYIEMTRRATYNRQKRLSLKEDEIYIAFLDPHSVPPVQMSMPNPVPNQNHFGYVHFP